MANATRAAVYEVLDSERSYQEQVWGAEHAANPHSVTEWLVYIRDYTEEALHFLSREAEPAAARKALHWVRKVGGMAVACMEQHGAPFREGHEPKACPLHVCTAPAWCGISNLPQQVGEPAATTARRNAFFEDDKDGERDRRSNRLFCSQGCLAEANGEDLPSASMRAPG